MIGPLPGVDKLVLNESAITVESLPAVRAAKEPLICVNPLLLDKSGSEISSSIYHIHRASRLCGSSGG